MLTHIKKYWIAYLVLVVVLVAMIFYNWGMIKGWFMQSTINSREKGRVCRTTCPDGLLVQYDCNTDSDPCVNHQK